MFIKLLKFKELFGEFLGELFGEFKELKGEVSLSEAKKRQ